MAELEKKSLIKAVPKEKPEVGMDTDNSFTKDLIEAAINSQIDISKLEGFSTVTQTREQIYRTIDTMSEDPILASYLRTLAEDTVETNEDGKIVWCESTDDNCAQYVNFILDSINADKHMFQWAHSLVKYGDIYLKLFRQSDYKSIDELFNSKENKQEINDRELLNESISVRETKEKLKKQEELKEDVNIIAHDNNDHFVHYVELVSNPGEMFELDYLGKVQGFARAPINIQTTKNNGILNPSYMMYKMKKNDVQIYSAFDYVHACLEDNSNRVPEEVDIFLDDNSYDNEKIDEAHSFTVKRGQSQLASVFKIWRELSLLENSALLNRITKSSVIKTVAVEVGQMPKEQVGAHLQSVKSLFEQKSALKTNESMSEYTNPGPMENIVYFPTRGGVGNITTGVIGGDFDPKQLTDISYFQDKMFGALGIPKQYFACLRGDTPITLLNGETVSIKEMAENSGKYIGKGIMACSTDGQLIPTTIKNVMLTKPSSSFIRIHLDNGEYVDVTNDHKMMLRDGAFILAEEVKVGDSLMPYYEKIKNGRK